MIFHVFMNILSIGMEMSLIELIRAMIKYYLSERCQNFQISIPNFLVAHRANMETIDHIFK